jgi:HK97 family phage major capsid protein
MGTQVSDLTQAQKDEYLLKYAPLLDEEVQNRVEAAFKNRDSLLEAQFEKQSALIAGQNVIKEHTSGYPVLGAFLWSMAKAGRDSGSSTIKKKYSDETSGLDRVMASFEKTVGPRMSKTINLATAGEGGLLVEGQMLELWLKPLVAMSVVLGLRPEMIPVIGNVFGVNGWEVLPTITWVEEVNTLSLLTQPEEGERESNMRKAMALMPVSAEYREAASPAVFRRLEEMMLVAFSSGFDVELINGAGLNNRIKGLRTLITATAASSGSTLPLVLDDVQVIMTSVDESNIRGMSRKAWIVSERTKNHIMFGLRTTNDDVPFFLMEMLTGTWLGSPFGSTTNMPTNLGGGSDTEIIFQAMDQFLVGQGPSLDVQWFENASYTQSGGDLVSTIEEDTEVLRGRQKIGTLMPRGNAGFRLTGVSF